MAKRVYRQTSQDLCPWNVRRVCDEIADGRLIAVLEEFSTPFPGYCLYSPQRRLASPAPRALIDYLRRARKPSSTAMARGRAPEGRSARPPRR